MNNETCYRCGASEFGVLLRFDENTSIVKCRRCGQARTYPYPQINFEAQEKYSRFHLDNEPMFRMFARAMMDVTKPYKTGDSFLDIGCSVGYLLDEAKNTGFTEIKGIELNKEAAEVSRKRGHTVYAEPLEKLNLESEKFDTIVINHVLEHIVDFKPFLAEIRRVLKNDGIVYCGFPNYNSFMRRLLGKAWYGWAMPDHVWHFELKTFKTIMEENGFAPKTIKQNALHYPYSKSLRKNTRATLARIADKLGLGDHIYGIFAKR